MANIFGDGIVNLLNRVMESKQRVQLVVAGTEQGIVTLIARLPTLQGNPCIVISSTAYFTDVLRPLKKPRLICEFMDSQSITYRFVSELMQIRGDEVWLSLPDRIVRIQRRQNVRIGVSVGSYVTVRNGEGRMRLVLRDISIGGMAVIVPVKSGVSFNEGDVLADIRLVLYLKDESTEIGIKSAVILRLENDPDKGTTIYGCRFMGLDSITEKKLMSYILGCEREAIRKSLGYE